jgi:peptidyl-prolyl cis-trans isomerase C
MKRVIIRSAMALIITMTVGIILTACGEKSPENVLVKVDDTVITLDDFQREWRRQPPPQPGTPMENVDQFIDDMIAEKLFIIEARRRKIDQGEKFKAEVEKYREQLMVETLLNQEVLQVKNPAEAEIERYWADNKAVFIVPALTRFSHILITGADGEEKEVVLSRCQAVKGRLDDGEPFAVVAGEVSDGSSANRGGDLGFYRPSQISPEFQSAAEDLDIGIISEPIATDYGYHIIVVTDRKPSRDKTLDESREGIIAILLADSRKAKFDRVKTRLSQSTEIQKNTDLLNRLRSEQRKAMTEVR